jgi:hypothetical protein
MIITVNITTRPNEPATLTAIACWVGQRGMEDSHLCVAAPIAGSEGMANVWDLIDQAYGTLGALKMQRSCQAPGQ